MIKHKHRQFLIILWFLLISILFTTCGIEEYYFLPQLQELSGYNRFTQLNTYAEIYIPSIPSEYYYANGYVIFYRIYLSGTDGGDQNNLNIINPALLSDYNFLLPFTDITNNTSITNINTFSSRRFYELEYAIGAGGGNLKINFPTEQGGFPVISLNDDNLINLSRSSTLVSSRPVNDLSFRNTTELNNNANAITTVNADVAQSTGQTGHAYAAMYIVAIGQNPQNFTRVYSKPTFISVFKLPNAH
ncbi:MAG: hypothetical protein FWD24_04600 [Treponema sp.]|nr:hypothetical protein [Treponema sp.]